MSAGSYSPFRHDMFFGCRAHVAKNMEVGSATITVCAHCGVVVKPCNCIKDDEPSQHCRACNGTGWVKEAR
jgi:hypothetical protein